MEPGDVDEHFRLGVFRFVGGGLGFVAPKRGMWEKGVDYELGDLRVVGNKITFSGKGNRKMSGVVLVGLG
jgi:hypothetical protein